MLGSKSLQHCGIFFHPSLSSHGVFPWLLLRGVDLVDRCAVRGGSVGR